MIWGVAGRASTRDEEFVLFVTSRARGLRRTAYLLTGDWHSAEDLTQSTLTRLYAVWGRIARREAMDGYARQTLVRLFIDEKRRKRSTEVVTADTGEPSRPERAPGGDIGQIDDRLALMAALAQLPARQRAVLVLRFYDDLEVAAVARLLGCPEGTVKSLTSRGLAALRTLLPDITTELTEAVDR